MTTRRWFSAAAVVLAAAIFATAASAQQVVVIGTNPQGTIFYSVGAAIARVFQDRSGRQTRVQPSAGTSVYVQQLSRGEIEFGFASVQDSEFAYRGVENFQGRPSPELRLVAAVFPLSLGLAVPNNSPAKSVADLKGFRMPSEFPAQSVVRINQSAMLATAGLSMRDMRPVPVTNYIKGIEALSEGKVDAALVGPGAGASREANVKLGDRGGLRFLSLDSSPKALSALRKIIPRAYYDHIKPSPAFPGVLEPTTVMSLTTYFVASARTPDDLVYQMTRILHESKGALAKAVPVMARFDPNFMAEEHLVPYHPGAEKYYREIGQLPPKAR